MTVSIMDVSATGGFGSNNVTVNRNGQKFRGAASNLDLNNNNQSIKLRFTNANKRLAIKNNKHHRSKNAAYEN